MATMLDGDHGLNPRLSQIIDPIHDFILVDVDRVHVLPEIVYPIYNFST